MPYTPTDTVARVPRQHQPIYKAAPTITFWMSRVMSGYNNQCRSIRHYLTECQICSVLEQPLIINKYFHTTFMRVMIKAGRLHCKENGSTIAAKPKGRATLAIFLNSSRFICRPLKIDYTQNVYPIHIYRHKRNLFATFIAYKMVNYMLMSTLPKTMPFFNPSGRIQKVGEGGLIGLLIWLSTNQTNKSQSFKQCPFNLLT